MMKICGLIFGKRTIEWLGGLEFTDKKNNLHAKLDFSKERGYFTRGTSLPIDCLEGSITRNGGEVAKIQGSWLEFIKFNDKL